MGIAYCCNVPPAPCILTIQGVHSVRNVRNLQEFWKFRENVRNLSGIFQQFLVCQENLRNSKIHFCFICITLFKVTSDMKIGMIGFWNFNWFSMLTVLELINFLSSSHVTSFCKQGPLMCVNSGLVLWIYWIRLPEMSFSLCT